MHMHMHMPYTCRRLSQQWGRILVLAVLAALAVRALAVLAVLAAALAAQDCALAEARARLENDPAARRAQQPPPP